MYKWVLEQVRLRKAFIKVPYYRRQRSIINASQDKEVEINKPEHAERRHAISANPMVANRETG